MLQIVQDFLNWTSTYLSPQPPSARDGLDKPPSSQSILGHLHKLDLLRKQEKQSTPILRQFRISSAFVYEEDDREDVVYIEVIMLLEDDTCIFSHVNPSNLRTISDKIYKIATFSVLKKGYEQLLELQRDEFDKTSKEQDELERYVVGFIDKIHLYSFTCDMPEQTRDETKRRYVDKGLTIVSNYDSAEGLTILLGQRYLPGE